MLKLLKPNQASWEMGCRQLYYASPSMRCTWFVPYYINNKSYNFFGTQHIAFFVTWTSPAARSDPPAGKIWTGRQLVFY